MIKKLYVVGSNTKKSLSPVIFNYWFKKNNISAKYKFKEYNKKNFKTEIKKILDQKTTIGFNVTIPFKETMKKMLHKVDLHAVKIGAVNFVVKENNKWIGKNTDWLGFEKSINLNKRKIKKNIVIVIGYGGASKAVIYSLKKMKFKKIIIANRTVSKINKIKDSQIKPIEIKDISKYLKAANLIVNTTPVDVLKNIINNKRKIDVLACDIVYSPKETGFLSHFKKNKRIYGISMLVHQAKPCFENLFSIKIRNTKELFLLLDKKIK